jgi:S-adenosylmethionine:tRNA ribosyltransferase-isomerase
MKTADFDYDLPPDLIAQHPAAERDRSRMMVVHRGDGTIAHRTFTDLPAYLRAGDVLVVNNTRVIPARVFGRKPGTGGRVEILLLEEVQPGTWDVLLHAARRPAPGSVVELGDGRAAAVILADEGGRTTIRIQSDRPWREVIEEIGLPPLPPYIKRKDAAPEVTAEDRERYQTLFAERPGAVAAPTAGLHFTPSVLAAIEAKGVARAAVTLHVGVGTFRPVEAENVEDHEMAEERYEIGETAAGRIEAARRAGGRVVAVGSTTVRALETVAAEHGAVVSAAGRTRLFIRPPHAFQVTDALLTNFHLPRSTLLMMVSAFAGRELVLRAYAEAVRERYRFYSYGDCMLIL